MTQSEKRRFDLVANEPMYQCQRMHRVTLHQNQLNKESYYIYTNDSSVKNTR